MKKTLLICLSLMLVISLAACSSEPSPDPVASPSQSIEPSTEPSAEPEDNAPEVAEIVSPDGEETTVYKLADGGYLDRISRLFTYNADDGTWTDPEGVVWSIKK